MTPQREFQGVWIPAHIWLDESITWMEKCLLAEIQNLSPVAPKPQTGCFASNEYLAKMFDSTEASIANMICRLKKKNLLKIISPKGQPRRVVVVYPINEAVISDNEAVIVDNGTVIPLYREILEEKKDKKNPAGAAHQEFIKGWCEEYEKHFGYKYRFQEGKDGSAVKKLLSSTGLPVDELKEIFLAAWTSENDKNHFFCKKAVAINAFVSNFNQIRAEIRGTPVPKYGETTQAKLFRLARERDIMRADLKKTTDNLVYDYQKTPEAMERLRIKREELAKVEADYLALSKRMTSEQ